MSQLIKIPVIKNKGLFLGKKRRRTSRITGIGVFFVMLSIFVFMLTFVWLKVSTNNTLVEIRQLKVKLYNINAQNENLRAEVTRLSSFDRIQKIARTELGLDFLPRENVIEVTQ